MQEMCGQAEAVLCYDSQVTEFYTNKQKQAYTLLYGGNQ